MIRQGIFVAIGTLLLAATAWGQVCYPQAQQPYPYGQQYPGYYQANTPYNYGPPPGHYYCNQHRKYCSHGYTTPEVYDNSRRNNDRRWSNKDRHRNHHWKKNKKRGSRGDRD